ncbi:aspartate 1-decarboxylase [Kribbella albertanoniae]|uniref:Aspartate 1-decarboxylase n=1 Tax=Kribbella albertanoniae TaxID=1266829 RepID=A0A4V2XSE9_9ACTN|nr:aspartate 1-decarboxylase [Kribbella albertanoniae]TDC33525.1 aspartate 1-decarboxylase [Kribbella albertanoniae]
MLREVLGGKIHRATVTQADLHYVGSLTIDVDLARAAGLIEGEKVQVVDITNGARLETYIINGPAGGGEICINGAAAHLIHPGDLVIIMSFLLAEESELVGYEPKVVHVDADNRIIALGNDLAEPVPGAADQLSARLA